jgi:hypothetical protein
VAFDTGRMARLVVEQGAATREDFRERMSTLKSFEGATGTISFDVKREAARTLFFLQVGSHGVSEIAVPKTPEG